MGLNTTEPVHYCFTFEAGWRPCPPNLCEAEKLVAENENLTMALKLIQDGPLEKKYDGLSWAQGVATSALVSLEENYE